MVTNLFSIFDPSTSISLFPNWLSVFFGLLFLPLSFWLIPSRLGILFTKLVSFLTKEFGVLFKHKSSILGFIGLFLFILMTNLLGLIPYVFTSSSHLVYSLSLSLPLWVGYTLFQWKKDFLHSSAHLVPEGTPFFLMPFMVLVESISLVIRPLTLAIRLVANMIAGHLLMVLLSGVLVNMAVLFQGFSMVALVLLLTLEIAVAVIQAYVFVVLSVLYASEV